MNIPAHPPHTEDEASIPEPRRRAVIAVICLVVVLASIHLLRAALS